MRQDLFGSLAVEATPVMQPRASAAASTLLPTSDGDQDTVLAPQGNGANPAPAVAATAPDSCDLPRSMNKIVSGPFIGGLTMDNYYPDLVGAGFWAHPGSGGTFDTGSQVGGNTQLFGVIPSPCPPAQFQLSQTATISRYRINGTPDPLEGTTVDDMARSGRDYTVAPQRQEFLGGGAAPLGYIISMADPPSVAYNATRHDVERDVTFVSSLRGPGGSKSVSWSQSLRVAAAPVAGPVVTRNTLA